MSTSTRLERLLRLLSVLQSGHVYNARELSEILRVSRRTVFRDLSTLQDCSVNVVYSEDRQGYSLPQTVYVQPLNLSLNEALSLLILCGDATESAAHHPLDDAAKSASLKILGSLPQHLRDALGELTNSISFRVDAHAPHRTGREHYQQCLAALSKHQQLRIRYRSLSQNREVTTLFSPYRIVFLRRSWYAIGRSSFHREVRTFSIARIIHSELVESTYQIPANFDLDRYLGNAWHLVRDPGGKSYAVVIHFQPGVARNVEEVRWHKTQETRWNEDGTLRFAVTVDSLREIVWWVLGYGDQAQVIEPNELRDEIVRHAEGIRLAYSQ
jgi:predicted DNA-binding transcriptional regulator YafY